MRRATAILFGGLFLVAASHPSKAEINVTFVNSYRYSKMQNEGDKMLKDIRTALDALGAQYLTPDELLTIEILDIAPAGLADANGATPSRMDIRYVLEAHGKTILRDQESLSDADYVGRPAAAQSSESGHHAPAKIDPALSKTAMLRDWFAMRFADVKALSAQ